MQKLSVIIPVHNEAETIRQNVLRLERYLEVQGRPFEIVISEDGSTDGTVGILEKLAGGRIIFLHDDRRLGKGAAIKKALSHCSGENIFIMDADLPAGLGCVQGMAEALSDYDIVLGSRMIRGSETERSHKREFLSRGYNLLIRMAFRTGVRDHQCGVKAMRSSMLRELAPSISSRGFFWDTEMIVRARQKGFRIAEFPIKWKERSQGKSKISLSSVFTIGASVAKFWLKLNLFRE